MSHDLTLAGYAVLFGLCLVCEAVARRTGRIATFGRVVETVARHRMAGVLLLAVWLWLGWHTFVRVHR